MEKYSVVVEWEIGGVTNKEVANQTPINHDDAKILLQKIKKTIFPKSTTNIKFEIVEI